MQSDLQLSPPISRGELLFEVVVPGQPTRAKHACTCHGRHPGTRPLPDWARWRREAVALLESVWRGRPAIAGPVVAEVTAIFDRPKRPRKTFTLKGIEMPYPFPWTAGRVGFVGRPDYDQVWKAALDVCVHAGVLLDDLLVQGDGGGARWYAAKGEEPHVLVRLWSAL